MGFHLRHRARVLKQTATPERSRGLRRGYAGAAMRIVYVVGTRPNFVKTAPVIGALRARLPEGRHAIVHTGQHYDRLMSEVFLEELGVPAPDHMLEVGSGSHASRRRGRWSGWSRSWSRSRPTW